MKVRLKWMASETVLAARRGERVAATTLKRDRIAIIRSRRHRGQFFTCQCASTFLSHAVDNGMIEMMHSLQEDHWDHLMAEEPAVSCLSCRISDGSALRLVRLLFSCHRRARRLSQGRARGDDLPGFRGPYLRWRKSKWGQAPCAQLSVDSDIH